jgi:hypothetical protein
MHDFARGKFVLVRRFPLNNRETNKLNELEEQTNEHTARVPDSPTNSKRG